MYVSWDTETTGLPMTRDKASPENVHNFDKCRMVSISFVTFTSKGRELSSYHSVVYPDNFTVEATEIHGITHDHALMYGKKFEEIYNDLLEAISNCDTLVAHNSIFDQNVLFSECYRRGLSVEPFEKVKFRCTLDMVKKIYMKPKKLEIIYDELTGSKLEGAHDALNDARACGVIFPMLRDKEPAMKNLGIPKIILKASEIASIVGVGYTRPHEIMENIWHKYSPSTFKGKTQEQLALEAIEKSPVAQGLLEDAEQFKSNSSREAENKNRAIGNKVEKLDLHWREKRLIKEYLRKTVYTNHGIRHEEKTASDNPEWKEDDRFYKLDVCEIEGTLFQIVGRIDRIEVTDGVASIIEIKNRVNKLFRSVRDYELIQCETYMAMLNIESTKLVEQYQDEKCVHYIRRDKQNWQNNIFPKILNFCEKMHSLMSEAA